MREHHPKPVENYTNPALVMACVNLTWILAVIWAVFGFGYALALAFVLNHLISRLAAYRAARN